MFTKEEKSAYMAEKYADQKKWFIELLGGVCAVCGFQENLEFDHIDWTKKSFTISRYYGKSTLDKALQELKKCQLLCHEHHAQKSRADWLEQSALKTFRHGTTYAISKKKCRCDVCLKAREVNNAKRRAKRNSGSRLPYNRPAEHGTILMYRRKCRCSSCRAANAAYAKQLRKSRT